MADGEGEREREHEHDIRVLYAAERRMRPATRAGGYWAGEGRYQTTLEALLRLMARRPAAGGAAADAQYHEARPHLPGLTAMHTAWILYNDGVTYGFSNVLDALLGPVMALDAYVGRVTAALAPTVPWPSPEAAELVAWLRGLLAAEARMASDGDAEVGGGEGEGGHEDSDEDSAEDTDADADADELLQAAFDAFIDPANPARRPGLDRLLDDLVEHGMRELTMLRGVCDAMAAPSTPAPRARSPAPSASLPGTHSPASSVASCPASETHLRPRRRQSCTTVEERAHPGGLHEREQHHSHEHEHEHERGHDGSHDLEHELERARKRRHR